MIVPPKSGGAQFSLLSLWVARKLGSVCDAENVS